MGKWRNFGGRNLVVLLAFVMMFLPCREIQSFGARKISTVSITVTNTFKIGEACSAEDVEVTTNSKYFSIGDIVLVNEEEMEQWGVRDVPVIEVTLEAEQGSYFSIAEVTDIKVKGAEYMAGTREDSDTMIVRLRLPSLRGQVGEIEHAQWVAANVGSWTETYNTGYYEVRLFREDKGIGSVQKVVNTSIDFAPWMTRSGNYSYKVRAVNVQDETVKSEWKQSEGAVYIDENIAGQFKNQYGAVIPEGLADPGELAEWQKQQQQQYGWLWDNVGWWYRNEDNTYTTNDWQLIDGKWYYFDSVGYMVTGWIDWNGKSYYCSPDSGEKLVSTIVPDGSGRRVDSTGAMIE